LLLPKLESLLLNPSISLERVSQFVSTRLENSFRKNEKIDPFDTAQWELYWIVDFMKETASLKGEWIQVLPIEDKVKSITKYRNLLEHQPASMDYKSVVKTVLEDFKTLWKFSGRPKETPCGMSDEEVQSVMSSLQQLYPRREIDTSPDDWVSYVCCEF